MSEASEKARKKKAKLMFLGVALVIIVVIYMLQLREPDLQTDWHDSLAPAMKEAKANGKDRVMVFVTNKHLSKLGEKIKSFTLGTHRTQAVLKKLGYPKVRLKINEHPDLKEKYNWPEAPFLVLLDLDGKEVAKSGYCQDVELCKKFLGMSYKEAIGQATPKEKPNE